LPHMPLTCIRRDDGRAHVRGPVRAVSRRTGLRWTAVGCLAAILGVLPALVAALPVPDSPKIPLLLSTKRSSSSQTVASILSGFPIPK